MFVSDLLVEKAWSVLCFNMSMPSSHVFISFYNTFLEKKLMVYQCFIFILYNLLTFYKINLTETFIKKIYNFILTRTNYTDIQVQYQYAELWLFMEQLFRT